MHGTFPHTVGNLQPLTRGLEQRTIPVCAILGCPAMRTAEASSGRARYVDLRYGPLDGRNARTVAEGWTELCAALRSLLSRPLPRQDRDPSPGVLNNNQ